MAKLTQAQVRAGIREAGALNGYEMTFRRVEGGDFRVGFKDRGEESAYYTNDLEDALYTGRAMAKRRAEHEMQQYRLVQEDRARFFRANPGLA